MGRRVGWREWFRLKSLEPPWRPWFASGCVLACTGQHLAQTAGNCNGLALPAGQPTTGLAACADDKGGSMGGGGWMNGSWQSLTADVHWAHRSGWGSKGNTDGGEERAERASRRNAAVQAIEPAVAQRRLLTRHSLQRQQQNQHRDGAERRGGAGHGTRNTVVRATDWGKHAGDWSQSARGASLRVWDGRGAKNADLSLAPSSALTCVRSMTSSACGGRSTA